MQELMLIGLVLMACSGAFLQYTGPPALVGSTHSEMGPLYLSNIYHQQENAPQAILIEVFSQLRLPLP